MILILTRRDDEHADYVIAKLEQRGADYLRFETADFPLDIGVSVGFHYRSDEILFATRTRSVDLRKVHSVWYRRPDPPRLSDTLNADENAFVKNECGRLLTGLWGLLGDRFWVNPFWETKRADSKPYQLSVAKSVGLEVPKTLMTNDPSEAARFFSESAEDIVYKTYTPFPGTTPDGRGLGIYTRVVDRNDLDRRRP
ncbi:MAG: MvdC/MvdD family ATP grasp protein [Bryobacteraceae bacterium]